ncbi:hypothetical protein [Streptomyces canus]|uniref:hypothetical protein n=1 Tax=Streptomyces canus TaxID=58343 RepID=UPI000373A72D|nr:hypothetical protein [Streptomyces canus]
MGRERQARLYGCRAQRREAELEPAVREVYESVGTPVAVAHALVLARLGRLDEAAAVPFPARPVTDHLCGMELDHRAELAVLPDDRDTAGSLIASPLPLREQFAGTPGGACATRPLAHALADLYRFLGERAAARGRRLRPGRAGRPGLGLAAPRSHRAPGPRGGRGGRGTHR